MAEVRQATGLTDFGDHDFRAGLARQLASMAGETRLDTAALVSMLATMRHRLKSRLEVEAWYREHPEVNEVVVREPVFITGLPRTGTTALANVLSLDDQFRPLRAWEQNAPCPPPVLENEAWDPRRLAAEEQVERLIREDPEFAAMHLSDAGATEEDFGVLGMAFHAQQQNLPISEYLTWWRTCDMGPTFAWHRRVVGLLQSSRPPDTWLFKAPAHAFHLEALQSAYPDARFVVTHRDPAKAVPSTISLLSALLPRGYAIDPVVFGRFHTEHLRIGAERAIAARTRIGEDRFLDIHHRDFVSDPFGTLESIYRFLGREPRPDVLERMRQWHSANRVGAHGTHRYTPEQFGLSAAQIHSDFSFYMKRFDVTPEP